MSTLDYMRGIFEESVEMVFPSKILVKSILKNKIYIIHNIDYMKWSMMMHLTEWILSKRRSRAVVFKFFGTWESNDVG